MTAIVEAITFDAREPLNAARFWAEALGWDLIERDADSAGLTDPTGRALRFGFQRVPEPKTTIMHDPDGNEFCIGQAVAGTT